MVQGLYDIMAEHWPPMVKSKKRKSEDALGEEPSGENVEGPDGDDPQLPGLEDDWGEAMLAEQLGAQVVGIVEPYPDSQILPDSMDPAVTPPEEVVPTESVEAEPLNQQDTLNLEESSSVSPTVIETSPSSSKEVVDVGDSPPPPTFRTEVKGDPMPSRDEYSISDLVHLRRRIAELKLLSQASVCFFKTCHRLSMAAACYC